MEAGLDIPDDVAIVGCGNATFADLMKIPLTSVDQQSEEIGKRAAKLALSILERAPSRPKQVVLEPKLVARASTARTKGRK
jgi:LacI family transcriptional regulator